MMGVGHFLAVLSDCRAAGLPARDFLRLFDFNPWKEKETLWHGVGATQTHRGGIPTAATE